MNRHALRALVLASLVAACARAPVRAPDVAADGALLAVSGFG